ncbi:hypothetical protein BJ986_002301 [Phycicoccus badiiscoriae]|uniref:Uncharacterized protein n=1 Tax=Pedococcus badiiscoriae TaxID=642776 RepID=A0A852WM06_9MICO|nr:hypothetical protein [Pedococcus badiiscoriae]NYG07814.1 hypothetical protein [Pedococcus badiiscoriae]
MTHLHRSLVRAQLAVARALRSAAPRRERGDVPGWVLITLMTAGLVAVLWAVAEDQLKAMFTDALDSARR